MLPSRRRPGCPCHAVQLPCQWCTSRCADGAEQVGRVAAPSLGRAALRCKKEVHGPWVRRSVYNRARGPCRPAEAGRGSSRVMALFTGAEVAAIVGGNRVGGVCRARAGAHSARARRLPLRQEGRSVRRSARRAVRRPRLRAGGRGRGRGRRHRARGLHAAAGACRDRRAVVRRGRSAAGVSAARGRAPRTVHAAGGRGHGQQRQDHDEGDGRERAGRALAHVEDRGQSEQPDRRRADAVPAERQARGGRHRDGRRRHGSDHAALRDRAADSGAHHEHRPGSSRVLQDHGSLGRIESRAARTSCRPTAPRS